MSLASRFTRRLALLAAVSFMAFGCGRAAPLPNLAPVAGPTRDERVLVARGEYIVRDVAACGGCHGANNEADGPLSGGAEFKDWRLGTARAANLTPDSATGIGTWTDEEIVRAVRNGTAKDGRLLAPVMPYEWFHGLSDGDALAIARYLRSLRPVRHEVRQSTNFIFKIGKAFALGPVTGEIPPAPGRAPTPEYGAYLAQHVGLCGECHTPRGGLMNTSDRDKLFAGNAHPAKDFPANPANLTPDSATGIGTWSEADFIRTIRTGVNPRGDTLNPFMPWKQVRRMTDDDLRAIYRYLRTVPAIRNEVPRR